MGFAMLLRNLLDFMFASPVMAVSSLVSVACASILVVNISSNMSTSNEIASTSNDGNYRDAAFQQNSFSQESSIYKNQSSAGRHDQQKSDYQTRKHSSNQSGPGSKRKSPGRDKNSVVNTNDSKHRGQYYVDDYSGLPTSSESQSYNNAPSLFNYSDSGNTSSVNTSTSTSATSATSTGNTGTGATTTTESDTTSDVTEFDVISDTSDTAESDFPATLENTVKIDLDETQIISCRPVVANGPPCMCTFTTSDASGSVSEVVDNCS